MRQAIPTPIACCTECGTNYNYYEFDALDLAEDKPRKTDGMPTARRHCEKCEAIVTVAGFHLMTHTDFWQAWEEWHAAHPDTSRKPIAIPENAIERLFVRLGMAKKNATTGTVTGTVLGLLAIVVCVVVLGMVRP